MRRSGALAIAVDRDRRARAARGKRSRADGSRSWPRRQAEFGVVVTESWHTADAGRADHAASERGAATGGDAALSRRLRDAEDRGQGRHVHPAPSQTIRLDLLGPRSKLSAHAESRPPAYTDNGTVACPVARPDQVRRIASPSTGARFALYAADEGGRLVAGTLVQAHRFRGLRARVDALRERIGVTRPRARVPILLFVALRRASRCSAGPCCHDGSPASDDLEASVRRIVNVTDTEDARHEQRARSLAGLYDEDYFAGHLGSRTGGATAPGRTSSGDVADTIVAELPPTTVLDAGCAIGFLVDALRSAASRPTASTSPSMRSPRCRTSPAVLPGRLGHRGARPRLRPDRLHRGPRALAAGARRAGDREPHATHRPDSLLVDAVRLQRGDALRRQADRGVDRPLRAARLLPERRRRRKLRRSARGPARALAEDGRSPSPRLRALALERPGRAGRAPKAPDGRKAEDASGEGRGPANAALARRPARGSSARRNERRWRDEAELARARARRVEPVPRPQRLSHLPPAREPPLAACSPWNDARPGRPRSCAGSPTRVDPQRRAGAASARATGLAAVLFVSACPGDAMRYRCDHQAEELALVGATVDVAQRRRSISRRA